MSNRASEAVNKKIVIAIIARRELARASLLPRYLGRERRLRSRKSVSEVDHNEDPIDRRSSRTLKVRDTGTRTRCVACRACPMSSNGLLP